MSCVDSTLALDPLTIKLPDNRITANLVKAVPARSQQTDPEPVKLSENFLDKTLSMAVPAISRQADLESARLPDQLASTNLAMAVPARRQQIGHTEANPGDCISLPGPESECELVAELVDSIPTAAKYLKPARIKVNNNGKTPQGNTTENPQEPSTLFLSDVGLAAPATETAGKLLVGKPAEPVLKVSSLKDTFVFFTDNSEKFFTDKKLPSTNCVPAVHNRFDGNYFATLSNLVSAAGPTWSEGTPNYCGARIRLAHTGLDLVKWRQHLIGYEDMELCQYLEYGFPIGLAQDPPPLLVSAQRNHGSSYQYYPWVDDFLSSGVGKCYMTGPWQEQPFGRIHVSPLMTAVKKPDGRRVVFDATFGENSLNNGTPTDLYLGQPIDLVYPKIEEFRILVLKCGRGCSMWKRDLSSFFLQIPLDPVDYPKVAFIWRSAIFFFTALMFGLRHSGYQGQRVTNAVTWVHKDLGKQLDGEKPYNSLNYSDDIAGVEPSVERSLSSAKALADLFKELGLKESEKKYHPPSTSMPFLGVQFDSLHLTMSVPPDKLEEVREELCLWSKKTTATKKTLQQLLGKLFWVSRCVRFSRPFMGRLLQQLRDIHPLPDNKKSVLSLGCKEDISWWNRYLRRFNGVELMYNDQPMDLSLDQLLDTPARVNVGDAQMWGGGAYYQDEYWSRPFPRWLQDPKIGIHLKEFYVVLVSAWLWGDRWSGHLVYIFSDNDAVIESLEKEKPKDPEMLKLVREFLYLVCTKKFTPVFRKIGTKQNWLADFISRCHDYDNTQKFFKQNRICPKKLLKVQDNQFNLGSNW